MSLPKVGFGAKAHSRRVDREMSDCLICQAAMGGLAPRIAGFRIEAGEQFVGDGVGDQSSLR